ncbi:ABC-F family ATP-binding cassette domain-containing protein [Parvularcula dongshanensis]|uniref:ATP-binding protein Uup n=1 Tax=Parvularcula dongshanensis TaxID=1173995 RepID=A0A840I7D5_9PROT|nr:ATP-binding cassette domain-containing protein [Parvularcula dongshanensis]MBB4660018.1 ATP-binding cassette subfamily F protein uup [Parvularcula dongshanensis]
MAPPLLTLKDIRLTFGGDPLLAGAALDVREGDRVALVGRNGSGKSTLLKIAAGLVEPDGGERTLRGGVSMRYLEQEPSFEGYRTIDEAVRSGLNDTDDHAFIGHVMEDLGLDPARAPVGLSGGEGRRVALARALAPRPDILLLDEPTNHLDLGVIEWLEDHLRSARAALVLISHDRMFLTRVTTRTVWLDRGETRSLDKGFGAFEDWRDETYEQEERDAHKLDRQIVREEHWLTYGVTARRKRNVRRLGELQGLRQKRATLRRPQGAVTMAAAEAEGSGKRVIETKGLTFSYAERPIVEDLSIRIDRGDRIGIAGPNGAGKTTLVKLMTGQIEPQSGEVVHGTRLELTTLDQQREGLTEGVRLVDAVTGGRGDMVSVGGEQRHAMSYLKDFLFRPEQARQPVSALSGGERGRLALAIALARPSNVLILDEPTNDLDLETLDVLEEALDAYQGTVILVSHDRDFLDRIVTSTLVPVPEEGEGRWREYPGGYSDMKRQRAGQPAEDEAAQKTAPAAPRVQTRTAKLSFKEQHALDTLPDTIASLEAEIEALQAELADPALFTAKPDRFAAASKRLDAAQGELSGAEDQWLELEEKREALAS